MQYFNVLDFNPVYSDVHKPLSFELQAHSTLKRTCVTDKHLLPHDSVTKPGDWESERVNEFVSNIDTAVLESVLSSLENFDFSLPRDQREQSVNQQVTILTEFLIDSAKTTFGEKSSSSGCNRHSSVLPQCVCVYVYVYVCMYVCVYVCTCVCMYVCMYACMHACMHVCVYSCRCVWMYVGARI